MIFLGKKLGKNEYPFIVAEISCNHSGNIDQAKQLIDAAKEAGADAVKIQCYTADEMTIGNQIYDGKHPCLPPEIFKAGSEYTTEQFVVKNGPWKNRTLYELYKQTETNYELALKIITHALIINIPCFASVFSNEGLNWLEQYGCPAYKIASFELTDTTLVRKVAKTGKSVVLSTGMASLDDIDTTMQCIDIDNTVLLHCVSAYPTKLEQANLWRIQWLENLFECPVGFSDHTRGIMAGPIAVGAGACMLEKHLALPQTDTEDKAFSLHPDEFKTYVQHCRKAAEATFKVEVPDEEHSKQFKRSIYVVKDVYAGEAFTLKNIRTIRPGYGMNANLYNKMLYKRAKIDIKSHTALKEDMTE